MVVRQIEDTYEAKSEKIPIPQKGTGFTKKFRAGPGQTHTQSGELLS